MNNQTMSFVLEVCLCIVGVDLVDQMNSRLIPRLIHVCFVEWKKMEDFSTKNWRCLCSSTSLSCTCFGLISINAILCVFSQNFCGCDKFFKICGYFLFCVCISFQSNLSSVYTIPFFNNFVRLAKIEFSF